MSDNTLYFKNNDRSRRVVRKDPYQPEHERLGIKPIEYPVNNDFQKAAANKKRETRRAAIKEASEKGGVIMFDLHPIRIGQSKYVDALKDVVEYGKELNGWFPTVTEAVNYWSEHGSWKHDASFCCLLTGDIDNFSFFDYLQRLF